MGWCLIGWHLAEGGLNAHHFPIRGICSKKSCSVHEGSPVFPGNVMYDADICCFLCKSAPFGQHCNFSPPLFWCVSHRHVLCKRWTTRVYPHSKTSNSNIDGLHSTWACRAHTEITPAGIMNYAPAIHMPRPRGIAVVTTTDDDVSK